jgi:hypothetical protein
LRPPGLRAPCSTFVIAYRNGRPGRAWRWSGVDCLQTGDHRCQIFGFQLGYFGLQFRLGQGRLRLQVLGQQRAHGALGLRAHESV